MHYLFSVTSYVCKVSLSGFVHRNNHIRISCIYGSTCVHILYATILPEPHKEATTTSVRHFPNDFDDGLNDEDVLFDDYEDDQPDWDGYDYDPDEGHDYDDDHDFGDFHDDDYYGDDDNYDDY